MLTTPFNTTYYYKTELLYNNQIEKLSIKEKTDKKDKEK